MIPSVYEIDACTYMSFCIIAIIISVLTFRHYYAVTFL